MRALSRAKRPPFAQVCHLMVAQSTTKARLNAGIKEAKWRQLHRLERDLKPNNIKNMGQVLLNITDNKSRGALIMREATLADELNSFYRCTPSTRAGQAQHSGGLQC